MREITILLAVFFAMYMTGRGYRRGALTTVAGWIPFLLAVYVLLPTVWREPNRVALLTGGVAALSIFIVGMSALRALRRWLDRRRDTPQAESRPRRWLRRCDRIAGAALGLLCSAIACLGLACLGSTLPFAYSVRAQSSVSASGDAEPDEITNPPEWVVDLGETCRTLADLSDVSVLSHVPRLRDYGHEVRALVTILNAPPDKLKRLAEIHGLTQLADLPAVQAAINDDDFIDQIQRLRDGKLSVVSDLVDSPILRDLVECREIRQITRTLTPSSLARDLTPDSDHASDSQ